MYLIETCLSTSWNRHSTPRYVLLNTVGFSCLWVYEKQPIFWLGKRLQEGRLTNGNIQCVRYTKRLHGLKTYSYESRLQRLSLTTLELRRLHIDLIWCYKIVFGLVDVKFDDFFKHAPLNQTRGHMYKLYKQISSTNVIAAFFVNRVVDVWNCLPVDIVDFTSLTAFKRTNY